MSDVERRGYSGVGSDRLLIRTSMEEEVKRHLFPDRHAFASGARGARWADVDPRTAHIRKELSGRARRRNRSPHLHSGLLDITPTQA